ncbi:MAG: hypothetical protein RLZZ520_232 [Bacteroidota bacterium]|jgi:hypothetical protein
MKFQEGDKIVVLATGEKGEVVEWINKKMLTIRVDHVEFPVYSDQINFTYFDDFTKPKEIMPKKSAAGTVLPTREKKPEKIVDKDGIWLSFFPVLDKDVFDDDIISHFKIYLLNHTDEAMDIQLSVFFGATKDVDIKSNVRGLDELYLVDLSLDQLSDHPKFSFEFSLLQKDPSNTSQFNFEYKPKAKQLFKLAHEVIQQQQASFKFNLFKEIPAKGLFTTTEKHQVEIEDDQDGIDLKKLMLAGFKVKRK